MNSALKSATHDKDFDDIEDLRKVCANYEKIWSTSGYDPRKLIEPRSRRTRVIEEVKIKNTEYKNKSVNEYLSDAASDDDIQGTELGCRPQQLDAFERRSYIVCWNCKDLGHSFSKCPISKTHDFCYGCGLAGKSIQDCYRCQKRKSGNFVPNVLNAGDPLSERTKTLTRLTPANQTAPMASCSKDQPLE